MFCFAKLCFTDLLLMLKLALTITTRHKFLKYCHSFIATLKIASEKKSSLTRLHVQAIEYLTS